MLTCHSPWPRPFAPPPPPRIAPPCSLASQLLWPRPTSHTRASSATAPRLPDADRHLHQGDGQTWDLPVSDTILLRVMCSSTPAGRTVPRMSVLLVLRSAVETTSAPTVRIFRGSITHPTQQLCTLRGRRYRRLTQHSPPGGLLGLTWAGLAPADRASLLAPSPTNPIDSPLTGGPKRAIRTILGGAIAVGSAYGRHPGGPNPSSGGTI